MILSTWNGSINKQYLYVDSIHNYFPILSGLVKSEATQFHSYYHLVRPDNPWDKNIVLRGDYNITMDFLDSIATDQPLGNEFVLFNS